MGKLERGEGERAGCDRINPPPLLKRRNSEEEVEIRKSKVENGEETEEKS